MKGFLCSLVVCLSIGCLHRIFPTFKGNRKSTINTHYKLIQDIPVHVSNLKGTAFLARTVSTWNPGEALSSHRKNFIAKLHDRYTAMLTVAVRIHFEYFNMKIARKLNLKLMPICRNQSRLRILLCFSWWIISEFHNMINKLFEPFQRKKLSWVGFF